MTVGRDVERYPTKLCRDKCIGKVAVGRCVELWTAMVTTIPLYYVSREQQQGGRQEVEAVYSSEGLFFSGRVEPFRVESRGSRKGRKSCL